LKAAVKSELSTEDFVFAEDEKEYADRNAQERECAVVCVERVCRFGWLRHGSGGRLLDFASGEARTNAIA
jgi:hypothetical protein